ncbi:MAG: hypothetical protein UY21_C0001G0138 [Microgenomates group bacterium GW2011_GWA1_48_10]|nr:MAG: hypothetical protein UY21_C0001G0138 [Microgenomates group bacterium GW2011_GWA1_48_10]
MLTFFPGLKLCWTGKTCSENVPNIDKIAIDDKLEWMGSKILDFLTKERICSLTTLLPDGSSAKFKNDPATIFLAFTPSWWRYTEENPDSRMTLSSED